MTGVAYHPDGHLIATSSWDRTIKIWDAFTGDLRQSLLGHADWVLHVEFSPDGGRIATAGADGAIKIWETASRQRALHATRPHARMSPAWPSVPMAGGWLPPVPTRRSRSGTLPPIPRSITWRGEVGPIARIAFFPDGRRLLVAGNVEEPRRSGLSPIDDRRYQPGNA